MEGPLMKYAFALAAMLSTVALATAGIAAGFPPRVPTIDHGKVAAGFVKGERVLEDQGLTVIAQRVVGRGSEMHDNTNHVFIIMDGEAEFITGGKLVNPNATEPGQTRGTSIEGGVSHHLTKGDVITIPAKTPHQWKDTSKTGSIGYFAVKYDAKWRPWRLSFSPAPSPDAGEAIKACGSSGEEISPFRRARGLGEEFACVPVDR